MSKVYVTLAADWAWDVLNDVDHTFISGLPFGFTPFASPAEKAQNAVVEVLKDAFCVLSDHALEILRCGPHNF